MISASKLRMANILRMNDKSSTQISVFRDNSGASRVKWVFWIIVLLAMVTAIIVISKSPAIKKKFPGKDPYALAWLYEFRENNYQNTKLPWNTSQGNFNLAQSAFLQGEIHEAEYFLLSADKNTDDYKSLKKKIEDYKILQEKLITWLYVERNFNNEPFVYADAYSLINEILSLSEVGYIRVRPLFLKGYLLLKEGRRTEARRIFKDLSKTGGAFSYISKYMLAKTYLGDESKEPGIKAFEDYLNNNPESRLAPLASYYMSKMYLESDRPDDALNAAKKGIAVGESSEYMPELLLAQESALKLTAPMSADESLIVILKRFPSSNVVFKRAIEVYEDWDEGNISLEKSDVLIETCNVLVVNSRYYQSKKLLDKLIPTLENDDLAYARLILAKRQKGVGEFNSSIKECKKAIELTDDKNLKTEIYSLMGKVYGLKKDVSSAEKYYSLAGKSKGEMSDWALREIARIAYKNGWRMKAEKYYGELVESFPDSKYASEGLNYLVVLSRYNKDKEKTEKYAKLLKEKGTLFEDRLKGEYYLHKIGKGNLSYCDNHPLAYYSFIAKKCPVDMNVDSSKAYPSVNRYKKNLAWEYFLAGCFDLAEKEYEFQDDSDDPYARMVLSYLAFINKGPHDGILQTRDFTAGNFQAEIEKGYSDWFFRNTFPMKYTDKIEKLVAENNFPISFILAIIRQESYFKESIKSSSGALGLMQIMPTTGKWIAQYFNESRGWKKSNLTNPDTNLKYGVWYQNHLRDLLGNEAGMILAGHNGGPGNVGKWKGMFPIWDSDKYLFYEMIPSMETRNFIRHVSVNQRIYEILLKIEGERIYF